MNTALRAAFAQLARQPLPGAPRRPQRARAAIPVADFPSVVSAASLRSERSTRTRQRHARAVLVLHRAGVDVSGRSFPLALQRAVVSTLRTAPGLLAYLRRHPTFAATVIAGTRRAKNEGASS